MEITEEQALRRFPELRELITVREAGWKFRLIGDRDKGLDGIVASYSQKRYTDALWIYDVSTVIGMRILDDQFGGGTVWSKEEGTLPEVVLELLGLPEPDDRLAPKLVKGSSLLWAPHVQ
jgi:hypothetical protein